MEVDNSKISFLISLSEISSVLQGKQRPLHGKLYSLRQHLHPLKSQHSWIFIPLQGTGSFTASKEENNKNFNFLKEA